ncbi:MAG: TIGR01244 family sulfur transferase [Brevirhabdus sp.]
MNTRKISDTLSVSAQITADDMAELANAGFKSVICNRPDGEGQDQPNFAEISAAAKAAGLEARYIPVTSGKVQDSDADDFAAAMADLPQPVLAYCRTGTRSTTLWALTEGQKGTDVSQIMSTAAAAGYDMSGVGQRILGGTADPVASHDIVIVGGGAGGIAVAASLLARDKSLDIAVIDPAETHYYQPGWTLVGGGVFSPEVTKREEATLIPKGVKWINAAVAAFDPKANTVLLEGCRPVTYKYLVVAPGLKLDWDAIPGLSETLGKNGVTSNYRYDLAPYTWELVQGLKKGRAIFTQPPMPIKCAGAPQKAMYLSSDHWYRNGLIGDIDVQFMNAGGVLFGVKEYVPALMKYIERYQANLNFGHTLTRIDGPAKTAWFKVAKEDGTTEEIERTFDMIHVVPPQVAPDFIRVSPLVDDNGWVDVDKDTLQSTKFDNIWSLGDVMNAPNAKTAAAARKQAPVVAHNIMRAIKGKGAVGHYDGYGSCPLTVERGKIVLAEFAYGGALMPSFPRWILDGTKPTRMAWYLKEIILPPIYWKAMLKGREWMAKPVIKG